MRIDGTRWATWIALAAGAGCTSLVCTDTGEATSTGAGATGAAAASTSASGAGQGGTSVATSSSAGSTSSSGQGGAAASSSSATTVAASSSAVSTSSSGQGGATSSSAGSTSSSSSGTGGGPLCAPAPLIGLDYSATPIMSARLDPTTGVVTDLAPLASLGGVSEGFAAYDHLTKHLYELGDSLYTIDAVTGALLDAVPLSTDVINPVVNSAGQLFVLDYDTFDTAIVDPTTGAVTDLAPFQVSSDFEQTPFLLPPSLR